MSLNDSVRLGLSALHEMDNPGSQGIIRGGRRLMDGGSVGYTSFSLTSTHPTPHPPIFFLFIQGLPFFLFIHFTFFLFVLYNPDASLTHMIFS